MHTRVLRSISIHAPLAGCDVTPPRHSAGPDNFNPRTPCGVRQCRRHSPAPVKDISIHAPLAGCDGADYVHDGRRGNFNPRTPCGVRHKALSLFSVLCIISIHAPLAGCDLIISTAVTLTTVFQSTHPLRGATEEREHLPPKQKISIHAPLAGCDSISCADQRLAPPTKGGLTKK